MGSSYLRLTNLTDVPNKKPTYLAIGSFDGVHRGHQAVIRSLVAQGAEDGARTAVLTFFPHPKRVLMALNGPHYLSTLDDRVSQIGELGVDLIITHPFNDTVRQTRAAAFIDQLRQQLDMRQLWGGNFALGYKREGDVAYLRQLGRQKGYTVNLVSEMLQWEGEVVSSTRIRRSLQAGEIEKAAVCLGRPYFVRGVVAKGRQMGRTIGFPTANLAIWEEQLLPQQGVYATYAWVDGQRFLAATNIGTRPTVDGTKLQVEAHLLDFTSDLYGQEICLEFGQRVRAEQKFASLDALKEQIAQDVATVRQQLTPAASSAT